MKTKLLKKLRHKYRIVGRKYHVIKYAYGVASEMNFYDFDECNFFYTYKAAVNRQREVMIKSIEYIKRNGYLKFLLKN